MALDLSAVILPDRFPIASFFDDVLAAERAAVRTVWTYDHLTWPLLAEGPWFGAVPLLAAAAIRTARVRLGTLVASPNFRHPAPFAKELMTLDQLSGGRLDVGVDEGTEGPEPRMPFTVAATGPRALTLAARLGSAWVTYGPYGADVGPDEWFAAVAEQSRRLTEALEREGRGPTGAGFPRRPCPSSSNPTACRGRER
jgi:alkanesulfonate monooxygenase SsuD/methylene tetrahydromethanopterin reductase-like flavin-dependent oxidoreductase (luciferase family)